MNQQELEQLYLEQSHELKEAKDLIKSQNSKITALDSCGDYYKERYHKLKKEKPVTSKWLWFLYGGLVFSAILGLTILIITR